MTAKGGLRLRKIKIIDIADIRTGFQVRSRLTSIDPGTHKIIQMRNISLETGQIKPDVEFCKVSPSMRSIDRYLLKSGEVLFLTRGNKHPATLITEEFVDFVAAGQFMILTINTESCLPEYLCWYLNSPDSKRYFQREARGTAVQIIPKTTLENLLIPLPDLQTQEHIVALGRLALKEEQLLESLKEKRKQLIYEYCKIAVTTGKCERGRD